ITVGERGAGSSRCVGAAAGVRNDTVFYPRRAPTRCLRRDYKHECNRNVSPTIRSVPLDREKNLPHEGIPSRAGSQEVGGRLHTFGELLRERNVELTEPALLRALKSSDADVRFLSAMKLAEDKVVGAVPA